MSLDKLIDLSRLQTFGEETIVPLKGAVGALADAISAMADLDVASENGAHGLRYFNDELQYANYAYRTVTPVAGDNPKAHGWYELVSGNYVKTQDEEVVSGKTYYEEYVQGWISIETGGGSSISIGDVSGATASTLAKTVTLTWSDPTDVVISGVTLAEWGGTRVVRKAGSAPTSRTDGTVVLDSKVRNAYASEGFVDDDANLEYNTTYYYRFFPYTKGNKFTDGSSVSVMPERYQILSVPYQAAVIRYDGTEKTARFLDFVDEQLSVSGDKATGVGTYTSTFTPKEGWMWWDGTLTGKTAEWTISKGAASITLDKASVTLNASSTSDTVTATVVGDGTVTAVSSDPYVATVTKSGNVFTINSVDDTTGTATITFSMADTANYNAAVDQTVAVNCVFTTVYGAEWDGTSTTSWTRTDAASGFIDPVPAVNNGNGSSPFDGKMPWSGMQRSTRTAGEMVSIPKFYYKITQNGNGMKVQIADGPMNGFSVSPAHMDRGDGKGERDVVYIGRYHCSTNDWKSTTGVTPKANITRSEARTGIHNLGSNIWQSDFATRFTLWLLYIVEFADWNSQAKIGYGCGNNSATENMGYTDAMTYHTGTKLSSRTTYGLGTQYRYIEGLWDNVYDWCDGCYYDSNGLNIILNPSSFSDSSNGISVGTPSSGYPSKFSVKNVSGTFPTFIPTEASGSETTYSCDCWNFSASSPCLYVGGVYFQSGYHGLFFVSYSTATSKYADRGCRLLELP